MALHHPLDATPYEEWAWETNPLGGATWASLYEKLRVHIHRESAQLVYVDTESDRFLFS